jgi:hypothetical protein
MASRTASNSRPNHRASAALVAAVLGLVAVPVAVVLSRQTGTLHLIDAVWAIPAGMVFSVAAVLFARGARGQIARSLERAGGAGRLRATRWLVVAGVSMTLAAAIAVGFYELLVRLEH